MSDLLDYLLYGPRPAGYGQPVSAASGFPPMTPMVSAGQIDQGPPVPPSPTQAPHGLQFPDTPTPQSNLSALTNPPAPLASLVHPSGANQPPINVVAPPVDNWQPKHNGILGQIADYLLDTHTGRGVDEKNMEGALEHLTTNPDEAVRRLAKFAPEKAMSFWNVEQDNKRQQANFERQQAMNDLVIDKLVDNVTRGMMNTATDPDTFNAVRQEALTYAQRYQRDYSNLIPSEYDPATLKAYVEGGVNVGKQQQIAQGDKRLQQGDKKLAQGDRRLDQGDVRLEQTGEDTASKVQTRAARVQQGQARINMQQQGIDGKKFKIVPTDKGNMVTQGNKGVIAKPDGSKQRFITNDGKNWVYVDTVAPKKVK